MTLTENEFTFNCPSCGELVSTTFKFSDPMKLTVEQVTCPSCKEKFDVRREEFEDSDGPIYEICWQT